MAGQGPDRREVIRILGIAAVASQFPGFSRWSFAQEHNHGTMPVTPRPAHYTPQFFSPEDYGLVAHLTELIIPKDETPGAKEAGVSEFIDFMVWSDSSLQERFRQGVVAMNRRGFMRLEPAAQQSFLERLAFAKQHQPGEEELQRFFSLFREYTVMGYYTTRIGMEQLDYPGLKLYSSSPACPHPNDPEHQHLPRAS